MRSSRAARSQNGGAHELDIIFIGVRVWFRDLRVSVHQKRGCRPIKQPYELTHAFLCHSSSIYFSRSAFHINPGGDTFWAALSRRDSPSGQRCTNNK